MTWQNKRLVAREDYGRAFKTILSRADADAFKLLFEAEFPRYTEEILGYLTAETPQPFDERVRELFGVVHPLNPMNERRTPLEGFEVGYKMSQDGKVPPWLVIVMEQIPWAVDSPDFRDTGLL